MGPRRGLDVSKKKKKNTSSPCQESKHDSWDVQFLVFLDMTPCILIGITTVSSYLGLLLGLNIYILLCMASFLRTVYFCVTNAMSITNLSYKFDYKKRVLSYADIVKY